MADSEDIQIRCRRCGALMAEGYFKPKSPWIRRKIQWWAKRLLCELCERVNPAPGV